MKQGLTRAECERRIIGLSMMDAGAFVSALAMMGDYTWSTPCNDRLARAAASLAENGTLPDPALLADAAHGAVSVVTLSEWGRDAPTASAWRAYVERAIDLARTERLAVAASSASQAIKRGEDACEVGAHLAETLDELLAQRGSVADSCIAKRIPSVLDSIERGQSTVRLVAWPRLERALCGLCAGEVTVIGGRTSIGKSTFFRCLVESLAVRGVTVVVISLEDTVAMWTQRMLSAWSGVSMEDIRLGGLTKDQWVALQRASAGLVKLPIYLERIGIATARGVAQSLVSMVRQSKAKIAVVDYLQCCREGGGGKENRHAQLGSALAVWKTTAERLGIPLIVGTQISRDGMREHGDKRPPPLWAAKESGDVENQAENLVWLWRPENPAQAGWEPERVDLCVMKAKNGRTGPISLRWDGANLQESG